MNNERRLSHAIPAVSPTESQSQPRKATVVVYACSGCSDAGELADRIARRLMRDGAVQMSCLAGIGGRVKSLVTKAETAERILVIDGCPLNCARKTLELAGFREFDHLGLHEIGLRKGSCPVTEESISTGTEAARRMLRRANEPVDPPTPQPSAGLQTSERHASGSSMPPFSRFKRFDVRELLQRGIEPFPEIRKRVDALRPDEGLILIAPFLPSPLIEALSGDGFASKLEHGPGAAWIVYFWRAAA